MNTLTRFFASLVESGVASILPQSTLQEMDRRLHEFPWMGNHIAWHKIEYMDCFEWGARSDEDAEAFLRSLTIGRFTQIAAFYGCRHPALLFQRDWLFRNIDVAAANSQQYFLFGIRNLQIELGTFAELETGCTIWGWKCQESRANNGGAPK